MILLDSTLWREEKREILEEKREYREIFIIS